MEEIPIPSNFHSIIKDFTNDLSITFSEYSHLWDKWKNSELPESELDFLFKFCIKVYPKHFFDILYIFSAESSIFYQNLMMYQPFNIHNNC